mmetsp:Transcript_31676/g.102507  ORF Transcript_31676/g.102507 Transcript_31676/m.102507 type:complete len:117 (+) Transcript_31676:268-618(+)
MRHSNAATLSRIGRLGTGAATPAAPPSHLAGLASAPRSRTQLPPPSLLSGPAAPAAERSSAASPPPPPPPPPSPEEDRSVASDVSPAVDEKPDDAVSLRESVPSLPSLPPLPRPPA